MDSTSTLAVSSADLGLLTDLYQLTMTACYAGERDREGQVIARAPASFELFTRRLPPSYGYLIAMGLEQALGYLEALHFNSSQISALQDTGLFAQAPPLFWELLQNARFSGDVWAVPEGTAVFAQEPLLRIEAPLWQAQLVETYLLNTLNYQTLIATRAARLRDVAGPEVSLLEFGSRRAFSPQGAVWAARAAIAAGLDGTSNVLAALQLGHRPRGTMAHSLVMALAALEGSEDEAFAAFHRYFPGSPLLIDTYDPIAAAERLAQARQSGQEISAVRLDSGNLAELARVVKSYLPETQVLASGDLDEQAVAQLRAQNAPIDGYGLGTKLVTGTPVNGVYKLVEVSGIPVMKQAENKSTYPGRKQIYRQFNSRGEAVADRLALASEPSLTIQPDSDSERSPTIAAHTVVTHPVAAYPVVGRAVAAHTAAHTKESVGPEQPLLRCVMRGGVRQGSPDSLERIAQRTSHSVSSLPAAVRQIEQPTIFPVIPSQALKALVQALKASSAPAL